MESKAVRQSNNVWTNKYFSIALGAMMVLFIVHHWLGILYFKYSSRKPGPLTDTFVHWHRCVRHFLCMRPANKGGYFHTVYWAIILILILTNVDLGDLKFVGKRLGWATLANLVLLVFLALRNTPLAPLSGRSYEKLRPLHKTAGYTAIGMMLLHTIVYLAGWSQSGSLHKMQEIDNAAGAVAGVAMLVIGLTTIGYFVRKSYEVFYMVHLLMLILIMIMVGMHRPKISTQTLVIVIFTSCMWFSDRLVRLAKNEVHVRLKRNVLCRPGSHVFLWLPSVRLFGTHPFTMVSSNPPEFVIRAYDEFTRDLYYLAHKKQGQLLRCSMDGEYGQVPVFMEFDKVILVAGGSGASFTFAIALGLLEQLAARNTLKRIEFLWAIRSLVLDSLKWFEPQLAKLQESACVNISIYVTRDAISSGGSIVPPTPISDKSACLTNALPSGGDIEMGLWKTTAPGVTLDDAFHTMKGQPDIRLLISDYISGSSSEERVVIGGCGPIEMIDALSQVVQERQISGPSVTLHTEESMW
ncbi:ferric reductase like transmembrane component-domain-containing protein [Aspergillus caelatus]|uniref:Ferric reductase like transmembrane component-domain-containing protein n=1 Tax=Aspergillus caelatus TaxID=61420 RepID=A0A5N7AKB7_9EURO|nr:ferric reductase like transmembrane component-domain-containing protein [Aspergillus caelatus]KAE8369150.1 ferric reductase like transmembrane component-domain-containing protein [Aspergillus caelatus]